MLGFNSRRYDLNLIKAHIVETSTSKKVNVAVKGRNIMFLAIAEIKFLDISNYLAPYTSLDTWCKSYECRHSKLWFPLKWFDSTEKLVPCSESCQPFSMFCHQSLMLYTCVICDFLHRWYAFSADM